MPTAAPNRLFAALLLLVVFSACSSISAEPPPGGTPVHLSGAQGVTYTQRIALPSPYVRITFTYQGEDNFIVRAHYTEMGYDLSVEDTLINAIGSYQGAVFIASAEPVALEIMADKGSWEATIEGLGYTEALPRWAGRGDSVSDFFTPPPEGQWRITHRGERNFIVQTFCLNSPKKAPQTIVVNAIGPYDETLFLSFSGAPCLWIVQADGEWRFQLEE